MGKYGNGIKVSDGNGKGMGMGMKSLKWEGIGTKNLFPHISIQYEGGGHVLLPMLADRRTNSYGVHPKRPQTKTATRRPQSHTKTTFTEQMKSLLVIEFL